MHTPGWECYLNQSLEDRTMASTFLSQNFSVCSLRNRGMGLAYSFFCCCWSGFRNKEENSAVCSKHSFSVGFLGPAALKGQQGNSLSLAQDQSNKTPGFGSAVNPQFFPILLVTGACVALRVGGTMQVTAFSLNSSNTRISEARPPGLLALEVNGFGYVYVWQHPPPLWNSQPVCTTTALLSQVMSMRQPTTKCSGASVGSQRRDRQSNSGSRPLLKEAPGNSTWHAVKLQGPSTDLSSYYIRLQAWESCDLSRS